MKRRIRVAAAIAAVGAAGVALTFVAHFTVQVEKQARQEEARPADVILVLGAAEYRGKPSPVLRARLDHALELYDRGLAPLVMTTGGAGGDPVFTEGAVGRMYLMSRGVPSEKIVVETEGSSTVESTALAGEIMRRMGLRSAIVVSDGYHIFRVKKLLEASGVTVYGSPRRESNPNSPREWWNCVRQSVGYLLWSAGVKV